MQALPSAGSSSNLTQLLSSFISRASSVSQKNVMVSSFLSPFIIVPTASSDQIPTKSSSSGTSNDATVLLGSTASSALAWTAIAIVGAIILVLIGIAIYCLCFVRKNQNPKLITKGESKEEDQEAEKESFSVVNPLKSRTSIRTVFPPTQSKEDIPVFDKSVNRKSLHEMI
jgi:hypothetical protein